MTPTMSWMLIVGGFLGGIPVGYAICMWFVVSPMWKLRERASYILKQVEEDREVQDQDWSIQEEYYF